MGKMKTKKKAKKRKPKIQEVMTLHLLPEEVDFLGRMCCFFMDAYEEKCETKQDRKNKELVHNIFDALLYSLTDGCDCDDNEK